MGGLRRGEGKPRRNQGARGAQTEASGALWGKVSNDAAGNQMLESLCEELQPSPSSFLSNSKLFPQYVFFAGVWKIEEGGFLSLQIIYVK